MQLAASDIFVRTADLSFADCRKPGFRRVPRGKGFVYHAPTGRPLRDKNHLARIHALVLPPAWRDVWICTDPDGHLQATGIDARGRKQYRYHPHWTVHRNLAKFDGLATFARALPAVRRRVHRDMGLPGIPRDKVLACIVHLLDTAHLRIGNDRYAKENDSYGLTTIRNKHVTVRGGDVQFSFRAKSGKVCTARVHDPAAAKIVRRCQELPGQELFAYLDDAGVAHDVASNDVNEYLERAAGFRATAKDFRTWGGTVVAAETLLGWDAPTASAPISAAELKRRETAAVRAAATALSNTVATCRKFYVHPILIEAYTDGRLHAALHAVGRARSPRELRVVERALTRLLKPSKARASRRPR